METPKQAMAFTIAKRGKNLPDLKERYEKMVTFWRSRIDVLSHYYETSPKGLLHVHGVCHLVRGYNQKLLKDKGYSIHFKPITDIHGWLRYCKKDQPMKKIFKERLDLEYDLDLQHMEAEPDSPIDLPINIPSRKLF